MVERQSPEKAISTLERLWDSTTKQVIKIAVQQQVAAMIDPTELQLWQAGGRESALLRAGMAGVDSGFHAMTRRKIEQGVDVIRIQIIKWPLAPDLSYVIELYRRLNAGMGNEKVYLVAAPDGSRGQQALTLPATDLAVFDQKDAVSTYYGPQGEVVGRDIYSADIDPEFLQRCQGLVARLEQLAIPGALQLQPPDPHDYQAWYETADGAAWLERVQQSQASAMALQPTQLH